MKALQASLTLLTACTLAACGGGGSSGGDTQPPASTATITGVNFEAAATEGYAGVAGIIGASGASGLLIGVGSSDLPNWKAIGLAQSKRLIGVFGSSSPALSGASTRTVVNCPNGGTITVTDNDVNGNQLPEAGDSVSGVFVNCSDPSVGIINGAFTIKLNATPTGDLAGPAYTLDATLTLANFQVVIAGATQIGNGSIRIVSQWTTFSDGVDRLEASSFGIKENFGGITSERSVSNFSARQDSSSVGVSTTVSGVLSSSLLGGSTVSVQTPVPFVERNADFYPYTGQLIVSGSQGGRAVLTALNAAQVRLDLDANGDGVAEQSSVKAWDVIQ